MKWRVCDISAEPTQETVLRDVTRLGFRDEVRPHIVAVWNDFDGGMSVNVMGAFEITCDAMNLDMAWRYPALAGVGRPTDRPDVLETYYSQEKVGV
jgi:hypothetical protein